MVTSVAVSFIEGKRYLSVSLDGESATTMQVDSELHCLELLQLLWPDPLWPREDRLYVARRGGGFGFASTTARASP